MQCSMNKPKKMKFPFSLFLSLSSINAIVRFTHAHGTLFFFIIVLLEGIHTWRLLKKMLIQIVSSINSIGKFRYFMQENEMRPLSYTTHYN